MPLEVTDKTDRNPNAAKVDDFLRLARKRFKTVVDAESILRGNMLDDKRFHASDQWPPEIRAQREREGRPCLTINRLPQFVNQITNQQRENKPAPVVNPVDSDADVLTAEVFQGMIRHIEQQSQAQVAYNTAGEAQAITGRGWLRLLTDYESPTSYKQRILIKRVRNQFSIYMDPACQELDYSDADFAFVVSDITADEFKVKYPGADPVSADDFASCGDDRPMWMPNDRIRVAEYWYAEYVEDSLLDFGDGKPILQSQIDAASLVKDRNGKVVGRMAPGPDGMVAPQPLVRKRTTMLRSIKQAVINGVAILEGNDEKTAGADWPGQWIPIVPVIGQEIDLDGKIDIRGIVRDAKDPQRRYNFWVTAETEIAALAPKAPYVAAVGQIEGFEDEWKTANVRSYSVLPYKPVSEAGHLVGPPQRISASTDISSMAGGIQQADNDLKAVTGFYDASLGAPGPEQSGKAILARQRQSDVGSYNFQDNMNLAISTLGRYLVDLIPKVYDVPTIMRISGEDGVSRAVMVHAGQAPPEESVPEWVSGVFDLGAGTYDVTVNTGPSYQSKRAEFVQTATQLIQANPDMMQVIGDLLVRNMDWPGAQEIADRLKKMLPPGLQEPQIDPQTGQPVPPTPELMAQMQQLQEQMEAMQAELQKAQEIISGKQIESQTTLQVAQMEQDTKLRIAEVTAQVDLAKVQASVQQTQMTVEGRPDLSVAQVESASREKVAQQNALATLIQTQAKTDAAKELEALKAIMAQLSARIDRLADVPTASREGVE